MATVLHIDASVDLQASKTRQMSSAFVSRWAAVHPGATIVRRDLGRSPPPSLSEPFVRAVKTPTERRSVAEQQAWLASEALAREFLDADRYVVGMPMHILTVPSPFKAYVEQIFHEDRVFRLTETGPSGLLGGRKFLFFLSKGADYRCGAPLSSFDMLEPYLWKLLTFCGVAPGDITFVSANNALSPVGSDGSVDAQTADQVRSLAQTW